MLIYRQLKKRKEKKLKEQQDKKKEEGKMGNKQGTAANGAGKAAPNYKGTSFHQPLSLHLISYHHSNRRGRCEHFEHRS
jgi:hypothetical protein